MVNYKKYFLIYALVYVAIVLINLAHVPIIWIDETMIIDPAYNLYKYGSFSSKIWQIPGTEKIFAAYMPMGFLAHMPFFYLFPITLFFLRLPWLLLFAGTVYFLFKTFKNRAQLPLILCLILVFIFIHDEGITNAMRSGRVEMPLLFFLSMLFYFWQESAYKYLVSVCITCLALCHPIIWILCAIMGIYHLSQLKNYKDRLVNILLMSIPVVAYLYLIQFNFAELYAQLHLHSSQHKPEQVPGNVFYNHFFTLFMPTYKTQPYMLALNLLGFIFSVYRIIKYRNIGKTILEICFVATSLFITISLSPFWRYSPSLVYLIFLMIPLMLAEFRIGLSVNRKGIKVIMVIILIIIASPFWIRNAAGIIQQKQRNIEPVFTWLDKQIGPCKGKILIVDEPAAHLYSMNRNNIEFTLVYGIRRFKYADYEKVFLLTHSKKPRLLKLKSIYHVYETKNLFTDIRKEIHAITYEGMRLYEVTNEEDLQALYRDFN